MRNWLISTKAKETEYYDGIQIHADLGVHQQAYELFSKYVSNKSTVLDVGAGEGAFSKRLHDNGYNVSALDVEMYSWKAQEVPFLKLDINNGIAASVGQQFDSACCLEVIEHVENPWELLRDIRKVVKPGGILLMSTPNITSFWSRMYFLRSGFFHQFMPYDLQYGHINPMSEHEIKVVAKNTGWEMLDIKHGGYLPVFDFSEPKLKLIFSNLLRGLFYMLSSGSKKGWCLFFVMRRTKDEEFIQPKPGEYLL